MMSMLVTLENTEILQLTLVGGLHFLMSAKTKVTLSPHKSALAFCSLFKQSVPIYMLYWSNYLRNIGIVVLF